MIKKIIISVGVLLAISALFLGGMAVGYTIKSPTLTPTPPTATEHPAQPVQTEPIQPAVERRVIHDYQLKDLLEVSTSEGGWIHVEYWTGGEAPEYETLLPGGRYQITFQFAGGHVWEYPETCSKEQVMEQIFAHIGRRLSQKANNGGFIPWEETGFFEKIR